MNGRSNFGRLPWPRCSHSHLACSNGPRSEPFFLGLFLVRQVVSACNSMIILEHFKQLAAYNRWANARLYAAALDLSELSYRLHTGVYFGSLHGTLNHLLLTDRLWLKRLTGEGDLPNDLNAILYEDRIELTKARIAEDNRMIEVTGKYDETALRSLHSYKTTAGMPQSQVIADISAASIQSSDASSRPNPRLSLHPHWS